MRRIFCLAVLLVNFNLLWAQSNPEEQDQIQYEDKLSVTPDLLELVVDMDPDAQGFLAKNHLWQVGLGADFIVNGQLSLDFQFKLHKYFAFVIPISVESNALGQWIGRKTGIVDARTTTQWIVLSGLGAKIRLSEWIMKSSIFIEPVIEAGYGMKTTKLSASNFEKVSYIRVRPALYLGAESVFDTGFVVGAKLGVQYPFDFPLNNTSVPHSSYLSVVPMVNLGYAW